MKAIIAITAMLYCAAGSLSAACITEETEPNNSASAANGPICDNVPVSGSVSRTDSSDWFFLDIPELSDVTITLSHQSGADADWYFYEASRTGVNQDIARRATSMNPEVGTVSNVEAGRYYIEVNRWSGSPNYQLTVTLAEPEVFDEVDCGYGFRPAKPNNITSYLTGTPSDVCIALDANNPALLLMGGGSDVDAAFSQRIRPHLQGGNIVVLRTSGADGYNDYFMELTEAASVESIIVNSRDKANSDYVDWAIRTAEFVWMAGGDQSTYVDYWQGTRVQEAIQYVYSKGGVIGGTSAGSMVLSEFVYDPGSRPNAISRELVADFCDSSIHISSDFLQFPQLAGTLNDTHFANRDRMGRSAVLLAHLGAEGRTVSIDERASLFVGADGTGIVDGTGAVYVLRADEQTVFAQTDCGQPVIIHDLLRHRLVAGDQYDLFSNSSDVRPIRLSIDGSQPYSQAYNPTNPYLYYTSFLLRAEAMEGASVTPAERYVIAGEPAEFQISLEDGWQITEVTGCYGVLEQQSYRVESVISDCDIQVHTGLAYDTESQLELIRVNQGRSGATLVQLRWDSATQPLLLQRDGETVAVLTRPGRYNDQFKTSAAGVTYQLCEQNGLCTAPLWVQF
ncbi:Type 1 glutamine amidotransferase-like domain-containing protein [Alkalimonas amylolytica]|uniref:Cyanophycinase n=1 Tax=Alkalimonas amylolytica TaxID=152573 RepID=A0A1H3XYK5_ALKAM|nr:Type 1 glutamine amidotransferase-like domain-containing protein [Alkalimonas amylolytica]SEA04456.1 cyanophycinase [Alkalimonas amylolytica]